MTRLKDRLNQCAEIQFSAARAHRWVQLDGWTLGSTIWEGSPGGTLPRVPCLLTGISLYRELRSWQVARCFLVHGQLGRAPSVCDQKPTGRLTLSLDSAEKVWFLPPCLDCENLASAASFFLKSRLFCTGVYEFREGEQRDHSIDKVMLALNAHAASCSSSTYVYM